MNPIAFYTSLDRYARLGFALGAVLILSFAAFALWWLLSPREQLLFGGLKQADAAEIVSALDEWKVPYTIVDDGAGIAVSEEVMYQTRMRLVSAGIPRGGHVGFELFDDSDFGVTEFAQRVNYQRALQGEIERTIAALPGVESARVHLTIRRPGLFVGDRETSKASVAIGMTPGQSLSRQQVRGIRSLIAAAVEGLAVENVSVVDAAGALLAGSEGAAGAAAAEARDDEQSRIAARIQGRVSELLGQVLDSDQFRVSVDVTLDYDSVRQVNERPLDDSVVARKRVNARADVDDARTRLSDEDVEYRHGTVREEISRAPGRVGRISIAVILPVTLDDGEVARIESLIIAAAGLDEARGDRLAVSRLGRDAGFAMRGAEADAALAAARDGAPGAAGSTPVRSGFDVAAWPVWSKIVLFVIVGMLLGLILAVAMQRRQPTLTATEREAVLGRMRVWLAEGDLPK